MIATVRLCVQHGTAQFVIFAKLPLPDRGRVVKLGPWSFILCDDSTEPGNAGRGSYFLAQPIWCEVDRLLKWMDDNGITYKPGRLELRSQSTKGGNGYPVYHNPFAEES